MHAHPAVVFTVTVMTPSMPRRLVGLKCLLPTVAFWACGDPDIRRGDDALGAGQYQAAIGFYEQARARLPQERTPTERIASAHRSLAMSLLGEGRCDDAKAPLDAAEALTRPLLIDHQLVYECAAARGRPPEVLVPMLERLLALGDHRASVIRRLMQLELELGRDDAAVSRVAQLEKRSTLTLDERRRLMAVLLALGRDAESWPHLEIVMQTSGPESRDPVLRLKYAELLQARGRGAEAVGIYRALATEYPANPLAHARLAAQLELMGDPQGALAARARAEALRNGPLPPPQEMRPLPRSRR